jgi:glycosyltransferase involved in cell wall biosynthesis
MNAPSEWPDLFTNSNAIYNVQNCEWAAAIYRPIHGNRVRVWSMGVDHVKYAPDRNDKKAFDFLVYDKVRWPDTEKYRGLVAFCRETLAKAGLSSRYLRYGQYPRGRESAYHDLLRQARAMLYLSENETQGFAYNEALSMDVPILAWNIGLWCDPYRHDSGVGNVPATSIPYWDERCGVDFRNKSDFAARLGLFLERLQAGQFAPREYVLDNLRLEQGAQRYLDLIEAANEELPRQESIRQ